MEPIPIIYFPILLQYLPLKEKNIWDPVRDDGGPPPRLDIGDRGRGFRLYQLYQTIGNCIEVISGRKTTVGHQVVSDSTNI